MLGGKKGMRDIDRGLSDISKGVADIKAQFTKDPVKRIEILDTQRQKHLDEALTHRQKAKGLFNGPARLRMAEAAEASAEKLARQISKIREEHGIPEDAEPVETSGAADRLQELQALLDQGLITEDEHARKRSEVLGQL